MFTRSLVCAAALAAGMAHAQSDASGEMSPAAMAMLVNADGAEVGEVQIFEATEGLLLRVSASDMEPGYHGFHLHETGACEGDFTSAGDHYNPDGSEHGLLAGDSAHAGDLPNIFASDAGEVRADIHAAHLTMDGDTAPIMDDDGSAFIIHENADSYQAEAGAGGRVACGIVEMAES